MCYNLRTICDNKKLQHIDFVSLTPRTYVMYGIIKYIYICINNKLYFNKYSDKLMYGVNMAYMCVCRCSVYGVDQRSHSLVGDQAASLRIRRGWLVLRCCRRRTTRHLRYGRLASTDSRDIANIIIHMLVIVLSKIITYLELIIMAPCPFVLLVIAPELMPSPLVLLSRFMILSRRDRMLAGYEDCARVHL